MAPRWTKGSEAQLHLESLFDDHTITSRTKASEAYNLSPLFHDYNFAAFQKHFDSTAKMKFGSFGRSGKRKANVVMEQDECIPFVNGKSIGSDKEVEKHEVSSRDMVNVSRPECLVGEFYDYVKRENNAIVVLLIPTGARGTCEIDANDLSILRVRWEWTPNTCKSQLLFEKEMATPSHRTFAKVAGLQKAYENVCGKNGAPPITEVAIQLPFIVRVQKECMKVTNFEGAAPKMVVELVAETGTHNSELISEFTF